MLRGKKGYEVQRTRGDLVRIVHLKKDLKEMEELAEETLFQVERRAGRKALRWECPWSAEKQST